MSAIVEPEFPAGSPPKAPSEGPHVAALEKAHEEFRAELASNEGYEDQGESDGVQLWRKPDPSDPYAASTVKGEAIVQNATPDQFLACVQLPGMRKRWDHRFESGQILERFNRHTYTFYTVMKGLGWLVYARDIAGAHKNYRSDKPGGEICIVQTSVEEPEKAPEQSGKTRATLSVSGWQLLPLENGDLKVTYIVRINLNGAIPSAVMSKLAIEIPTGVGRARDIFYAQGHAPFVRPTEDQPEPTVVFQTESMSDPGYYPATDLGDLVYRCLFTTSEDGKFDFVYSTKMYPDGVQVSVEGEGVETSDDGQGVVSVKCTKAGENVTVVIQPK